MLLSQFKLQGRKRKRSQSDIVVDCKRSRTAPPSPEEFSLEKYMKSKSLLPNKLKFESHLKVENKPETKLKVEIKEDKDAKFLTKDVASSLDAAANKFEMKLVELNKKLNIGTVDNEIPQDDKFKQFKLAKQSNFKVNKKSKSISPKLKKVSLPSISKLKSSCKSLPSLINLPNISSALNAAPVTPQGSVKLKPIAGVSLDYSDTNIESYKHDLLHNLAGKIAPTNSNKPTFNSNSKFKPVHPNIKHINFPYESNYTYLNKTYMNDVEKYPEYLELAKSLVDLSKGHVKEDHSPIPSFNSHPQVSPHQQLSPQQLSPPHISESPTSRRMSYVATYAPDYQYHYHDQHHHQHQHQHQQYQAPPQQFAPTYYHRPSLTPQTSPIMPSSASQTHKFVPITPPASNKRANVAPKSPPKHNQRVCISCGSDQSPCWRPSWSIKQGQLCNSCGLRFKKTSARCLNSSCRKIPAKGEWSLMQSKGEIQFEDGIDGYSCLECGWRVEVKKDRV